MTDQPPYNGPFGQTPQGGAPQPPGYPPGYAAPQVNAQDHPSGTTVLVIGILSLVLCQVLGPIAWIQGNRARRDIKARPDIMWKNEGMITAGWVLGIIASVILIASILFVIGFFVIGIFFAASATIEGMALAV